MRKILIVEDDHAIHQIIADVLENEGFKIFSAFNGKSGIQLAKEVTPDLIICDIMMPGISGYDVIENLSKDSSTSLIPFIFLSAMAKRDDIRKGMELGADDYISKPFRIDELIRAVKARFKKQELLIQNQKTEDVIEDTKVDEEGHIFLEVKNQPKLVKVNSIVCITANVDYTNVLLSSGEKIIVRRLLKKWEEILPEKIFIRIHRSTIINLNHIARVEKWSNHSLAVFLQNNEKPFIVSRRFSKLLKSKFHYK